MPIVLHLIHGFPPRETAGTERATARLVTALGQRGWSSHVLTATRAPGQAQYSRIDEQSITRVVNNWTRPDLSEGGRDRVMEQRLEEVIREVQPDLVHVHHTAFWSTHLRFDVPTIGTLHDYWGWCSAGGRLQRADHSPCAGPSADHCGACFDQAVPPPPWTERTLGGLARSLHPMVQADQLHRAWRKLPPKARQWVGEAPDRLLKTRFAPSEADQETRWEDIQRRNDELRQTWSRLDTRTAPSAFLAKMAEEHGLGPVRVVKNAVEWRSEQRRPSGPFVFIGTLQPHKGAHLVIQAYKNAYGDEGPGLRILGDPAGDVSYANGLDWPLEGHAEPAEVRMALESACALVIGSTWAENAPLVALEARAAGCPVIAPNIGGIPELVLPDRDGWLYPPGDVEALSALMKDRSGLANLEVTPPASITEQAAQFETLYNALL